MKDNKARFDPVEYSLRTSWQSIKTMYQDEASKYGVTYAIGFALLSIDPKKGTSSTSIGPIMGLEANSLSRLLKIMEIENHPFYIATQYHPEFISRPGTPEKVFKAFVEASIKNNKKN